MKLWSFDARSRGLLVAAPGEEMCEQAWKNYMGWPLDACR